MRYPAILIIFTALSLNAKILTLHNSPGYNGTKDCFIEKAQPDKPHNLRTHLRIRGVMKQGEYRNSLLSFDNLDNFSGLHVRSAKLKLFVLKYSSSQKIEDQQIFIFKCLKPWTENATWLSDGLNKNWDIPGIKAPSERGEQIAQINLADLKANEFTVVNLPTKIIQDWLDGKNANYGFLLCSNEGRKDLSVFFAASEDKNPEHRPALIIETTDSPEKTEDYPAIKLGRLVPLDKSNSDNLETEVSAIIKDGKLVVHFICFEPEMNKLKKNSKERDIGVWHDDCVEIFLNVNGKGSEYYHFALSASGNTADAICDSETMCKDNEFNINWKGKVKLLPDRWTATMEIPLNMLTITSDTWRVNFCRERKAGKAACYTWSDKLDKTFHAPEKFRKLELAQIGGIDKKFISEITKPDNIRKTYPLKLWKLNNKVEFPIGIYAVAVAHNKDGWSVFKKLGDAGFDTVVDYISNNKAYFEKMKKECRENNLNIIANVHSTIRVVKDNLKEKNIIGWYLADEPSGPPKTYIEKYKKIKSIDSSRPVMSVYCNPGSIGLYSPSNDIVMTDPYPRPGSYNRPITIVSKYMDIAHSKVNGEKPVIAVLQCFRDTPPGRYPNYQELRSATYLALNHNAAGIIYWAYSSSLFGSVSECGIWEALKATVKELKQIWPAYCLGKRQSTWKGKIEAELLTYNGQSYFVLVNKSRKQSIYKPNIKVDLYEVGTGKPFKKTILLNPEGTRVFTSDRDFANSISFEQIEEKVEKANKKFFKRAKSNLISFYNGAKAYYPQEKKLTSGGHYNNPVRLIDGSLHSQWVEKKLDKEQAVTFFLKQPSEASKIKVYYSLKIPGIAVRSNHKWITLSNPEKFDSGAVPGYGISVLGACYKLDNLKIDAVKCIAKPPKAVIYEVEVIK